MKYIAIGKIVNTHGIKGEVRLLSSFKFKNKVFKKDMPIYIGNTKKKEIINSYRPHKQVFSLFFTTIKSWWGYFSIFWIFPTTLSPTLTSRPIRSSSKYSSLDKSISSLLM